MPLPTLLAAFRSLPAVRALEEAIPWPGESVAVRPLAGSAAAVLTTAIAEAAPHRLIAVVAAAPTEAERWLSDLGVLLGDGQVALYPQREGLGEDEPHYEIAGERVETLELLNRGAVRVIGWVDDPDHYPIQPKQHTMEFLREIAHLRVRTNTFGAVARIRHTLSMAMHRFYHERGFFYVHTPIITASDCEGAGQMFRVSQWTVKWKWHDLVSFLLHEVCYGAGI
jgi:hypothetical protein